MAVPSWVYDDSLSDEEKIKRFKMDMKMNGLAALCGLALFPILLLMARVFGWQ